jgi:hypothetical protein
MVLVNIDEGAGRAGTAGSAVADRTRSEGPAGLILEDITEGTRPEGTAESECPVDSTVVADATSSTTLSVTLLEDSVENAVKNGFLAVTSLAVSL